MIRIPSPKMERGKLIKINDDLQPEYDLHSLRLRKVGPRRKNFGEKVSTIKYQIFISSTYEDLKQERDEVIKAILEMGHIPVGMEMFSAADEEQWKLIARQIDQSDYYIVIVAHRYGSVTGKKSYTEKEHDYAVKQGIPAIAFIIDDSASWPIDRIESDVKKIESLKKFKQKLKGKLVGFWASKEDLGGKVSRSLVKLITTNPRPGWVRTTETIGPEVVSEMSRLSSENARLADKNAQLEKMLEENIKIANQYFSQGGSKIDLEYIYHIGQETYESKFSIDWDGLFIRIAEGLLENTTEYNAKSIINKLIYSKIIQENEKKITSLNIKENEILKIKIQFIALGYIDIQIVTVPTIANGSSSSRRGSQHPHWILTILGKEKLAELVAIREDKNLSLEE
ncbi:MAG: DUF4062 domain-containing protein [Candidatus Competibacter sp.]